MNADRHASAASAASAAPSAAVPASAPSSSNAPPVSEAAALMDKVLSSTLVELRRAEKEAAMRSEQIDLQLRLAARMWERDLLTVQERARAERSDHKKLQREKDAQLVVAETWLVHTLASLADSQAQLTRIQHDLEHQQQVNTMEKREASEDSSFWEVLKWSKKKGAEGSPRPKTKDERETERRRELEKELSQYKAENERLRLMLKRTTQTARDWEEYSNREDAMEQIKSDKMVMTFLHSRVGDLEKQLNLERQEHQEAAKRAATAEAENELLKKRIADLDAQALSAAVARGDSTQLTVLLQDKDRQLHALKQGYAQLKVKKDILVAEVKKLQGEVARLGTENDRQKLDLQYLRSQEEAFHKAANREEYEISALLLEVDELRRLLEETSLEKINAKVVRERKQAAEELKLRKEAVILGEDEEQEHKTAEDTTPSSAEDEKKPTRKRVEEDMFPSPSELMELSNQQLESAQAEIARRKAELDELAASVAVSESTEDDIARRLATDRRLKRDARERYLNLLALVCDLRIQINAYSERLLALAQHKQERLHDKFVWIE